MAYKPYKTKKEKDIYARYDGKNTKANNYDNGSVNCLVSGQVQYIRWFRLFYIMHL